MLRWLLFLLVVVWLVSAWSRRGTGSGEGLGDGNAEDRDRRGRAEQVRPERMLRCANCEVFVPASKALIQDAHTFCCEAHAKAWAEKSAGTHR